MKKSELKSFKFKFLWKKVLITIFLHFCALQFLFVWNFSQICFSFFYGYIAAFGLTAGSHRLWSHRSYKANKPLKIILMLLQTICAQDDVIQWVRHHRTHHKFCDTDGDPVNSKRGVFFAHMGWCLLKEHPEVEKCVATINMKDVQNDPILKFQKKFYLPLVCIFSILFPALISMYILKPAFTPYQAFCSFCFRYMASLHINWLTNSAAHYGNWKPYDKFITASDSKVCSVLTLGDGWHNFHHTFPMDYKTSEHHCYRYNVTNGFIDFFAWIGWATDLKIVSDETIKRRVLETGDGSHRLALK